MKDKIIIFSDGASKGNPGPGGWGSIVARTDGAVTELGAGVAHTTNNKMELSAAIEGLKSIGNTKEEIILHTDSSYVINGITKWVKGWQKNDWKTKTKDDVMNRDLWQELIDISKNKKVTWKHVAGHAGVAGNERCDAIADAFATGKEIILFHGKISDYGIDMFNMKASTKKTEKKSRNKAAAYSYVSLVNGILHTDKTWAACEKRVKGVKGNVKFKKVTSAVEEKEIIQTWKA